MLGFDSDVFVVSSLIAAYGDSGEVTSARRCLNFAASQVNDQLACWNSILSACVHHGYFSDAVEILHCMKLRECTFDGISLVNILSFCTHRVDLEPGRVIHGYIIRNKFDSHVFVTSSLLELHIKCGLLIVACCLFTEMNGCIQNGFPSASLRLFYLMQQKDVLFQMLHLWQEL